MDRSAYEIRREQWRQIVTECNESGIHKKEWCRQNGISLRSIYYWQKRLRDEAIVSQTAPSTLPAASGTYMAPASQGSNADPVFVDITQKLFADRTVNTEQHTETHPGSFVPELMINVDGSQIYVSGIIQASTLETVMKVLRHA